jgi:chromosome segregation ATPase
LDSLKEQIQAHKTWRELAEAKAQQLADDLSATKIQLDENNNRLASAERLAEDLEKQIKNKDSSPEKIAAASAKVRSEVFHSRAANTASTASISDSATNLKALIGQLKYLPFSTIELQINPEESK